MKEAKFKIGQIVYRSYNGKAIDQYTVTGVLLSKYDGYEYILDGESSYHYLEYQLHSNKKLLKNILLENQIIDNKKFLKEIEKQ